MAGTCYCPDGPITQLEIAVDGDGQPALAHSMPRIDFGSDVEWSRDWDSSFGGELLERVETALGRAR